MTLSKGRLQKKWLLSLFRGGQQVIPFFSLQKNDFKMSVKMPCIVADTLRDAADTPHGVANTLHGAANTATFTAFTPFLANFEIF